MRRKTILAIALLSLCFLPPGLVAENQPQKKVMNFIAVMDLKCREGIKSDVCKALTDVIIDELVKIGTYTVIDRANRDKILAEQGFQQTGCVDNSCSVEAGRLLGVGKIIVGSATPVGSAYLINLQLVNVQTATVESSGRRTCKCEPEGLIDAVAATLVELMGGAGPVSPRAIQESAAPTDEIINQFFASVGNNDIKSVRELLARHPTLVKSTEKEWGSTGLIVACWLGQLEMVSILIDRGSDVNYHRSKDGFTSISAAATGGYLELAKLLIAKGARVDEKWKGDMNTPLIDAAWNGHANVIKLLIEKGADVNLKNKIGQTALMYAAAAGRVDCARILLDSGADIKAMRSDTNATAIFDAAWWGQKDMLLYLISRGADVKSRDNVGQKPLHYAAARGKVEVAEILLANGADPMALAINPDYPDYPFPPLFSAAFSGSAEMIKFLIGKGADVNFRNKSGQTALMYAAAGGNIETATYLFSLGFDVNAKRYNDGCTPIYDAIWWKKPQMVQFLISHGAKVNYRNKNGESPLYFAVAYGNIEIATILLKNGAKINEKTNNGDTPIKRAEREGNADMAQFLKNNKSRWKPGQ